MNRWLMAFEMSIPLFIEDCLLWIEFRLLFEKAPMDGILKLGAAFSKHVFTDRYCVFDACVILLNPISDKDGKAR